MTQQEMRLMTCTALVGEQEASIKKSAVTIGKSELDIVLIADITVHELLICAADYFAVRKIQSNCNVLESDKEDRIKDKLENQTAIAEHLAKHEGKIKISELFEMFGRPGERQKTGAASAKLKMQYEAMCEAVGIEFNEAGFELYKSKLAAKIAASKASEK